MNCILFHCVLTASSPRGHIRQNYFFGREMQFGLFLIPLCKNIDKNEKKIYIYCVA